jgi:hypothetical protein
MLNFFGQYFFVGNFSFGDSKAGQKNIVAKLSFRWTCKANENSVRTEPEVVLKSILIVI